MGGDWELNCTGHMQIISHVLFTLDFMAPPLPSMAVTLDLGVMASPHPSMDIVLDIVNCPFPNVVIVLNSAS